MLVLLPWDAAGVVGAEGDDGEVDVKRNLLVHRTEGQGKHLEGRCMKSGGDGNGDLP